MRFAWTDDFGYADMYAMPDSPAIIAKIRAAAQGFASIGGKVEQTDEVWEDFFPGFIATARSEEHTSELQSLMRISYAVFCLKKKTINVTFTQERQHKKT